MSADDQRSVHVSVLLHEAVRELRADKGGMFLDCTLGGGGHTRAILDANANSWVVALDRDQRAIERAESWAGAYGERLELIHTPFSRISEVTSHRGFDGVLADLGMSTDQLREGRGFSFADQEALDMRMDESAGQSARDFLNSASERELYIALAEGGVGKNARFIARALMSSRPYESAQQVAETVRLSQMGKRTGSGVHPATVVFQALRMAVNRERQEIEELLEQVPGVVKKGARLAVITFHSIEDKVVTHTMRGWESAGSYPASWRGKREEHNRRGHLVHKKPIEPSEEEMERNPASRSARLRVFEFEEVLSK
jgi:16S rRNA (cytosine1402-N4)-methyltransferase